MSSEGDKESRLQRVVTFLRGQETTLRCWSCGNERWRLIENPGEDVGLPLLTHQGAASTLARAMPMDALVCGRCGLVRLHSRAIVDGEVI